MAFREFENVCPYCGSDNFCHNNRTHIFGRFYCRKCGSKFFSPSSVSMRTSSRRDDMSYTNLNKQYANRRSVSANRNIIVILVKIVFAVMAVVGIIILMTKYFVAAAITCGMILIFYGMYRNARKRRRRKIW